MTEGARHPKYWVGQLVHLVNRAWEPAMPSGHFRVVRLLPREGADHQYRIQSVADGHERVVRESSLA
jgi:hypothetical protein